MYGAEEYAKIRSDFVAVLEIVCKSKQDAMRALLQYDNEYKAKQLG